MGSGSLSSHPGLQPTPNHLWRGPGEEEEPQGAGPTTGAGAQVYTNQKDVGFHTQMASGPHPSPHPARDSLTVAQAFLPTSPPQEPPLRSHLPPPPVSLHQPPPEGRDTSKISPRGGACLHVTGSNMQPRVPQSQRKLAAPARPRSSQAHSPDHSRALHPLSPAHWASYQARSPPWSTQALQGSEPLPPSPFGSPHSRGWHSSAQTAPSLYLKKKKSLSNSHLAQQMLFKHSGIIQVS